MVKWFVYLEDYAKDNWMDYCETHWAGGGVQHMNLKEKIQTCGRWGSVAVAGGGAQPWPWYCTVCALLSIIVMSLFSNSIIH